MKYIVEVYSTNANGKIILDKYFFIYIIYVINNSQAYMYKTIFSNTQIYKKLTKKFITSCNDILVSGNLSLLNYNLIFTYEIT